MVGSAVLKIIWSSEASSMVTMSPANISRMWRLPSFATGGEPGTGAGSNGPPTDAAPSCRASWRAS